MRNLAESLQLLDRVYDNAARIRGPRGTQLHGDWVSLREITGDYRQTLLECEELLQENRSKFMIQGARRNLEWHILIKPTAERLRQRIQLHNSKIQFMLRPFEM